MKSLFAHEFTTAPLALCDNQDCNLFNQQQKSEVIKLFEKECPIAFRATNPITIYDKWTLIIDGGQLLQIKPLKTHGTVYDYAQQLLQHNIIPEFRFYERIDIVFDSSESKIIKSFIKRHGTENKHQQHNYNLKQSDILESSKFYDFVHANRAKLASAVRSCWTENDLVDLLPINKHLIVAGPQEETIRLVNNNLSFAPNLEILDNLQSNHIEADTRMFLHIYDIQTDDTICKFNGIVIQSSDTDVFILSIAHINLMTFSNIYIKKFNTFTKSFTYIDIKEIESIVKNKWCIDQPNVLLVLHALSGCDTSSFTRNITKLNYFTTFLSNPNRYKNLFKFGDTATISIEPIVAAEDLLIACYKNAKGSKSILIQTTTSSSSSLSSSLTTTAPLTDSSDRTTLNSLRQSLATKYFKNKTPDICIKLPPTTDSFYLHCKRAWRQAFAWKRTFEQFDIISLYPVENYGYEQSNDGKLVVQWISIQAMPDDLSLVKCIKCTGGCNRCKCALNNLVCTPFCGCDLDKCRNRSKIRVRLEIISYSNI
jgi:hypothetical protein